MRHIEAGEVEQLERTKTEAGRLAQDRVDGRYVGNAFAQDGQRFGDIAAPGVVDDEARSVLSTHSGVPPLGGKFGQQVESGRVGQRPRHDLDHFHQGYRVEEMKARDPRRKCRAGGDGGHR